MGRQRGRQACGGDEVEMAVEGCRAMTAPAWQMRGGQEMKVEVPPQQGMGAGMTPLGDRDPAGCSHKGTGQP